MVVDTDAGENIANRKRNVFDDENGPQHTIRGKKCRRLTELLLTGRFIERTFRNS